jgi:hypothetical protein
MLLPACLPPSAFKIPAQPLQPVMLCDVAHRVSAARRHQNSRSTTSAPKSDPHPISARGPPPPVPPAPGHYRLQRCWRIAIAVAWFGGRGFLHKGPSPSGMVCATALTLRPCLPLRRQSESGPGAPELEAIKERLGYPRGPLSESVARQLRMLPLPDRAGPRSPRALSGSGRPGTQLQLAHLSRVGRLQLHGSLHTVPAAA